MLPFNYLLLCIYLYVSFHYNYSRTTPYIVYIYIYIYIYINYISIYKLYFLYIQCELCNKLLHILLMSYSIKVSFNSTKVP